jgi:hypothetical protein
MAILTLIFKSLTQDWPIIIDFGASRDVFIIVESPTLTSWEPEQDLSHSAREIVLPSRIVEERGRGTLIKKRSDLQHILDHQVELKRLIKLGVGFKEEERFCEFWFVAPARPAQSIKEHEEHMLAFFQEQVQNHSLIWAVPILASSSQNYRSIAKAANDTIEIWYTPVEWFGDNADVLAVFQDVRMRAQGCLRESS